MTNKRFETTVTFAAAPRKDMKLRVASGDEAGSVFLRAYVGGPIETEREDSTTKTLGHTVTRGKSVVISVPAEEAHGQRRFNIAASMGLRSDQLAAAAAGHKALRSVPNKPRNLYGAIAGQQTIKALRKAAKGYDNIARRYQSNPK